MEVGPQPFGLLMEVGGLRQYSVAGGIIGQLDAHPVASGDRGRGHAVDCVGEQLALGGDHPVVQVVAVPVVLGGGLAADEVGVGGVDVPHVAVGVVGVGDGRARAAGPAAVGQAGHPVLGV